MYAAPQRNLDPIELDLNEYNPEIRSSPRNPVVFNSPDNPYNCQPGICSYQEPIVVENRTKELYFFCGFQARMNGTLNCSITESSRIASWMTDAEASGQATEVENVYEVLFVSVFARY
jgi:hypothetical protein